MSPSPFKSLLSKLVKTPEHFNSVDITSVLNHIFTSDAIDPAQISALLTALHIHGVERRPESLLAASQFLQERALQVVIEDREQDFIVDIVGTGGDGHNTFNVSTTAAVVAAGAGARVIKHGGRASTSSSGSADLLQALGCLFPAPTAGTPMRIGRIPFTFIFAPHYHPAMAFIAPYRKALPFRTLFNLIGPLVNPARPHGMVLGVAERNIGEAFAQSLRDSGVRRALVVCGAEGLDEISCAGDTWAWELVDGKITEQKLHPSLFGLGTHPLSEVASGTPSENAETLKTLLTSGEAIPERLGPVLDFVLLNAAALLVVAGLAGDYEEGTEMAKKSITSGKAWDALETFRMAGGQ